MDTTHARHGRLAPWAAALALACVALTAACSSSPSPRDQALAKLAQTYPGHTLYTPADASLVLTVDNLAERAQAVTQSKVFAKLETYVRDRFADDPDMVKAFGRLRNADPELMKLLDRRLTLVSFPTPAPPGGEEGTEIVVLVDGNARELVQSIERLVGESGDAPKAAGSFKAGKDGVVAYRSPNDGDPLFMAQQGPIGVLSTDEALLRRVRALGSSAEGERLADLESYQRLREQVGQRDADITIWLGEWTPKREGWDALVEGASAEPKRPMGALGTLSLREGVDVHMAFEMSDAQFGKPSTKVFLKALQGAERAQTLPKMLPSGALAYMGLNLKPSELLAWMDDDPAPDPQVQKLFSTAMNALSGEFGIALTGSPAPGSGAKVNGFVLPGAVFIAKLSNPGAAAQLRPMVELLMGNIVSQPPTDFIDGVPGPSGRAVSMLGHEVMMYATSDPGLEVGYTFYQGHLLIGTNDGLHDVLNVAKAQGAHLLTKPPYAVVQGNFTRPSHCLLHLNLLAVYRFAQTHYAPFLGLLGVGMGGGPDDPMQQFFNVFRYAGGNLTFADGVIHMNAFVTAQDLP